MTESPLASSRREPKDLFIEFFVSPSREKLSELLDNHLGEEDYFDLKERWPAKADVARHVLAFANSGGGALVVGVKESADHSFESIGLQAEVKDKTDFMNEMESFLPAPLYRSVQFMDFDYGTANYPTEIKGKRFQLVFVPDIPDQLPFMALKNSTDLKTEQIYVRKGTSSRPASYEDIQHVLNRRIQTGHSTAEEIDFKHHLDQLEALYDRVPVYESSGMIKAWESFQQAAMMTTANSKYPKEGYQDFIIDCIEKKKRKIRLELGIR